MTSPADVIPPVLEAEEPLKGISPRPEWSDRAWRQKLRSEFAAGRPFGHVMIRPFLSDAAMRAIRNDLLEVPAIPRTCDLYQFHQTDDLLALLRCVEVKEPKSKKRRVRGALEAAQSASAASVKLPALRKTVELFDSPEFRGLLQEVAQSNELSGELNIAAQVFPRGGHLICHDDVVSSREVPFIYYLTDPDEEWGSDEGGALELYPVDSAGVPATAPSTRALPLSNALVFFVCRPGVSFHAVEEVYGSRARVSIQGFLHTVKRKRKSRVDGGVVAAIASQVQLRDAEQSITGTSLDGLLNEPMEEDAGKGALQPGDVEILRKWMVAEYLEIGNLKSIAESFTKQHRISLGGFLKRDLADKMATCVGETDCADGLGNPHQKAGPPNYEAGISAGWEAVGPPHLRRYLRYRDIDADTKGGDLLSHAKMGIQLREITDELFANPAFQRWLAVCTGYSPRKGHVELRRFRPGMDYTVGVRPDSCCCGAALDATLIFTRGDDVLETTEVEGAAPEERSALERTVAEGVSNKDDVLEATEMKEAASEERSASGTSFSEEVSTEDDDEDAGGYDCYMPAAEASKRGTPLNATPIYADHNTLNLVARRDTTLRFVKYLGRAAPCSRVDVSASFALGGVDIPTSEDDASD